MQHLLFRIQNDPEIAVVLDVPDVAERVRTTSRAGAFDQLRLFPRDALDTPYTIKVRALLAGLLAKSMVEIPIPLPHTLKPEPQTPKPKPKFQTLNPKPQTPNPKT